MDEENVGIGVVVISRDEYKELLRSQVMLEILRDACKREEYFNRDAAARYLGIEIDNNEK